MAASTVSGSVVAGVSNMTCQAVVGLSPQGTTLNLPSLINSVFTSGSGAANKLNQLYQASGTLATTASVDIDLYAFGGAVDAGGNAFTNAIVKALIFQNTGVSGTPVEADYITIGGKGTTAGWTSFFGTNTDTGKIFTGGSIIIIDPGATGYAVGASTTNHILTLTAGSNSGTVGYNIIVLGATS